MIAEISVPLKVNKLFSYTIPDRFSTDLVGKRVIVNFSNKIISGLVVNVTDNIPDIKLKEISDVLDSEPIANAQFLKFCQWIADYYLCSLGEVFFAAFPPKTFPQEEIYIRLPNEYNEFELAKFKNSSKKRGELINILTDTDGYVPYSALKNKYGFSYSYKQYMEFKDMGFVDISYEMKDEHKPKVITALKPTAETKITNDYINSVHSELLSRSEKQRHCFDVICSHYGATNEPITQQSLVTEHYITASVINSLAKKGLIEKVEIEISRISDEPAVLSNKIELKLPLADFQIEVLENIRKDIENGNKNILLHGITGSGKTLVYMHLIKDVLSKGQQVIMLLPEISLTPQLTDRFKLSFPGRVCTLHSKLNKSERYEIWQSINEGKYDIVIGPRSTIFAPMKNIGLIIVDEEHDQSYKQDSPAPRYNARDLAAVRGAMVGASVILGSATPSLESYYNAKTGKYIYYTMKERADSHKLPIIEIVDILNARKAGGMFGPFSHKLLEEINRTLAEKRKVILFQNRRGHSSFVQCMSCGNIPRCGDCDVTMTYHSYQNELICHYCGNSTPYSELCNSCGELDIANIGLGTQQVEQEIKEYIGNSVSVFRYDSDTITTKNKQRQTLKKFNDGGIDILVGTQMIAKGLDFSTIGLVGILNADVDLFMSDVRAAEKTYQLINQVAGRAGRTKGLDSKVILQTTVPNNYAIQSIRQVLNLDFLEKELSNREELDYPPFSRLVIIEFVSSDLHNAEKAASEFYNILPKDRSELIVLPPADPIIKKTRKKYRKIITIKNLKMNDPSGKVLRKYLKGCLDFYQNNYNSKNVRINLNIDASSVM